MPANCAPLRLAFVGDSLIHHDWAGEFPDTVVLALARDPGPASRLAHSLQLIISHHPDVVVVHTGSDDLIDVRDADTIGETIESFLARLRTTLPTATIVLNSILAHGHSDPRQIRHLNQHLRQFVATVHGNFVDLTASIATDTGTIRREYRGNNTTLSDSGYRAWSLAIQPYLVRREWEQLA